MERHTLMAEVERRAIAARIGLYRLCKDANVSGTVATRWKAGRPPTLPTIGKLERHLEGIGA